VITCVSRVYIKRRERLFKENEPERSPRKIPNYLRKYVKRKFGAIPVNPVSDLNLASFMYLVSKIIRNQSRKVYAPINKSNVNTIFREDRQTKSSQTVIISRYYIIFGIF